MPRKLIDYKFFEKRFDDIARIARETGELKKIAKFLDIAVYTLRDWRKKYPELENIIQHSFKDCPLLIKYEKSYFFEKHLDNIKKIAIETGELKKIAEFLKITPATLRKYRKKYTSLNEAIENGFKKYRPYTEEQLGKVRKLDRTNEKKDIAKFLGIHSHTLYKYSKKYPELEGLRKGHLEKINKNILTPDNLDKVNKIARKGFKKDVAKFLNVNRETLRRYYEIYPELKRAVDSGLSYRNKNSYMGRKVKSDLIEYNLYKIERTIEKTGKIKSLPQIFNISNDTFREIRRKHPELEAVIQRGLASYKANKRKLELSCDTEKSIKESPIELFKFKKPKKELIAHIDSVDSDMEDALARYRRMKEAEKEAMSRRELKNMDIL